MTRRSVLFSPGDQPELLRKAPESDADVVVFDLEDAVAPTQKEVARESVVLVLTEIDPSCEVCVRINPLEQGGREDLAALFADPIRIDSIMLPKVRSSGDVENLAKLLDEYGTELPVLALLETADGILDAPRIADVLATDAILFGAEDLAADIGATRTEDGAEVLYARQRVVLAASSADVHAIDTLHTDFEDTTDLEADTEKGIEMGFDGKMAIHPGQIQVINDAFTPDEDAFDWAQRVLAAKDEAEQEGRGVFTVDGEMIDAPLITQAEDIVERAEVADDT